MRELLPFLLLLFTLTVFSQKEANFWYFGRNAALDFNTGTPTPANGSKLNTLEGCSSFSNENGELIFYIGAPSAIARNLTIWNSNDEPMPNGIGLKGDSSSSQSALTVPAPGQPNIYYVFTVGARSSNNAGFWYYTIDMTKEDGLGDVVAGPVALGDPSNHSEWTEKVTAVRAKECNAFWVISSYADKFYAYKVNTAGVSLDKVSTINGYNTIDPRGYLKVSPDGKKLVAANMESGTHIFNFNDDTGEVTNFNGSTSLNRLSLASNLGYGVEFSSSSRRLYVSTGDFRDSSTENLFQFDLTLPTIGKINSSRYLIYSYNNKRGALQLAPNGKIYWTSDESRNISVINNPENLGSRTNYSHQSISVGTGAIASQGLPPFISSLLLPITIEDTNNNVVNNLDINLCIGESITITPENISSNNTPVYEWMFDNGSGKTKISDTAVLALNNLEENDSGTYSLTVSLENICGNSSKYNATFSLIVPSKPNVKVVSDYLQCDFDTNPIDGISSFNLASKESGLIEQGANVTIEFFEPGDTSFSSPITNTSEYRNTSSPFNHKIIVRVSSNISGCSEFGELSLQVDPTTLANYDDIYESEIDLNNAELNATMSAGSENAIFDFSNKIDSIIVNSGGAFNRTDFKFSFYTTLDDAEKEVNVITTPYDTYLFENDTQIFVRISKNNICSGVGQFTLYVNKRPVPKGNLTAQVLCVNNPVDVPQLFTINLDGSSGNLTDTYKWYLNDTLISGETAANIDANTEGNYKVEAYRNYENSSSSPADNSKTVGYNTFVVRVSNVAKIENIEFKDDQDSLDENKITIRIRGKGDYEYALNSDILTSFNEGPENLTYTFTDVKPGLNTIYIRDRNDCGIAASQQISFIFTQRHFTPNGDGTLDTWKILGVDNSFYKEVRLQIFDRYGKILKNIDQKINNGWDGNFNGKRLPSNDYWYNAILIDVNGNVIKKNGHFSLVR